MAERGTELDIQPALLDRLIDDTPGSGTDRRERRTLSAAQYRAAVLRDLEWLLNTAAPPESAIDPGLRHAAASVVNFGMPDFSGLSASSVRPRDLERAIARAIERFEPRVLSETLSVKAVLEGDDAEQNRIYFEIQGELWANPAPESLRLRTSVDLESGRIEVTEGGASGGGGRG
ncbi:MAG: type VI secretion system baseplate subunit TssE [Phycisphaerales bacterium]|nr:MAG: type VI secretion system baseplate subunit TssE [Phycisphaerales bacterium]